MVQRYRSANQTPLGSRLVSCVALGVYLVALVVMPAWHGHACEHEHTTETCCEHSDHVPDSPPVSDNSCPICEFAHLAVPFHTIAEPLLWQADIVSEISFAVSIPSVGHATALPPCRAPPVL
jgi:hypothetical protein